MIERNLTQPRYDFSRRGTGLSLSEVLIAAAVMLVITVTAFPNVVTVVSNARLYASMTTLSGIVQTGRLQAVKLNRTMSVHMTAEPHGLIGYVKQAPDGSGLRTTDSEVQLQVPIARMAAPSGWGAPTALDNTTLGFTPEAGDASFNSRGASCSYSGGNCTSRGFLYYFKDARTVGDSGWAALSISPGGRVKKWFWIDSTWTD